MAPSSMFRYFTWERKMTFLATSKPTRSVFEYLRSANLPTVKERRNSANGVAIRAYMISHQALKGEVDKASKPIAIGSTNVWLSVEPKKKRSQTSLVYHLFLRSSKLRSFLFADDSDQIIGNFFNRLLNCFFA